MAKLRERENLVDADAHPQTTGLLLDWYDRQRRDLPWRYAPGTQADAYRVWLSEVMLQQTTVKAVVPYFQAFTERWPTVTDLAYAPREDVLAAWAGLGYYSRARNLHACAQAVRDKFAGVFPQHESELLKLPGVGPYTAAAISAIAFGRFAVPVDGNIERVTSRLFAFDAPLPAAKGDIKQLITALFPKARPGDFAQALMDVGATICTPKKPSCLMCPVQRGCLAQHRGVQETLPVKQPKKKKPTRRGYALVIVRDDREVLLRWRPDEGLLGGMLEVPGSDWVFADEADALEAPRCPAKSGWFKANKPVVHVFTHFRLELDVLAVQVGPTFRVPKRLQTRPCEWVEIDELTKAALPSLMVKAVQAGLDVAGVSRVI
ncbi:MAG: A/G-specific adenine glycosylase [Pseudomonadota bacterium]